MIDKILLAKQEETLEFKDKEDVEKLRADADDIETICINTCRPIRG